MLFQNFSEKEGKNYCSSGTVQIHQAGPDFKRRKYKIVSFKILKTIEICGTEESICNKTANKLIKSLGIVIGNGPLKIFNFSINPDPIKNLLSAHIA
jgi:hypothetical protein